MLVDSLAIIREKAMTRRIRLATVLAPDDTRIQVDQRKLKQIVYNLLSNAVKFTPEGGQVVLQATRVSASDVGQLAGMWPGRAFAATEPVTSDTFLKISVTDSGIGIKADDLAVLFAPFTQVDSGLARKFDGTGLGLALVRRLAELQGGTVAVESQEDVGSSFIVWVPYHDAAPNAVAAHEYAEPVGVPTRYVTPTAVPLALIVEDDFKAAALLRMHLESIGLNVLHAASAEAALAMALQQPLDLISLDILLPNMDGWDFLSRIKQVPALMRVPVVIISIIDDHQRGFALGAAAIIQKPVTRQTLFESLVGLGLFPRAKGHTLNVLVVDDDPAAVELTAVRFEGMADSIACAYSGRDAIDMARAAPPDLIVLDLMMPDISGFDVVDALTQSAATAAIPILVVTAKEITAADHARLHEHVTAIMRKGTFDSEQFLSEARRAIAGRRVVA
jgi:CheY-like chemotaxis protein